MNTFDYPAPNESGAPSSNHFRHSVDSRINPARMQTESNGAMPAVAGPSQRGYGGMPSETGGYGRMAMPRSPPKNKSGYCAISYMGMKD